MKVLQLTVHSTPNVGGVETHLTDLVNGLAKRKHSVFVLTYRPLVKKASWKIYDKPKKNISILRLPWIPGFFYKFVQSPIVEFLYLVPGLFIAAPFVLLIINPDVIHTHGLVAGFIGVFWGKVFRKKVILTTHSLYHFPKKGMYYEFAKWIFTNADLTICLSDQSVEEIRSLGIPASKVKRFTYWVDLDIFSPMNKEKIKGELGFRKIFTVLFVGRLIEIKGVMELLKASKELPDGIRILIAGDGPLHDEIENEAKKNTRISFIGSIENHKLPYFYNAADVVIIPSIHEEGFGRVILESLACGTPVIGASRGAIPEAMDETVGKLITVTPKNIAQAIIILYKNKTLLNKLQKNARTFALKRYSEKNIKEIISLYDI
ncbi:MAG TPA: glycosyltransferase family 4 protein [Verrucomicrobiae bacterium]|nr:glycosyltransferase family 4 protein [Verrucomicrobiae bacterium]